MPSTARKYEAYEVPVEEKTPDSGKRRVVRTQQMPAYIAAKVMEGQRRERQRNPERFKTIEQGPYDIERLKNEALYSIGVDTETGLAYAAEAHDMAAVTKIRESDALSRKSIEDAAYQAGPDAVLEPIPADEEAETDVMEQVGEEEGETEQGETDSHIAIAKLKKEQREYGETIREMDQQAERLEKQLEKLRAQAPANDIEALPSELQEKVSAQSNLLRFMKKEKVSMEARLGEIALALVGLERLQARNQADRRASEAPQRVERASVEETVVPERGAASVESTSNIEEQPGFMKRLWRWTKKYGGLTIAGGTIVAAGGLSASSGIFGRLSRFMKNMGKPGALKRAAVWLLTRPEKLADWATEKVTGEKVKEE